MAGQALLAALLATVSGCGGGGGGGGGPPPGPTFSIDTSSLTYSSATPFDATPAGQMLTGTVTGTVSGTLYIVVLISGPAVSNVTNFAVSGASGQATVLVKPPLALGAGTYHSTLTVYACTGDPTCTTGGLSGSPKTVAVTYTVGASPPPPSSVMPHVVTAGAAGQVVIRGSGLSGTTNVSFGATAGSVLSASDTQVVASYPATLSPGPLSVQLNNGAIAFTGSVFATAPVAYAQATLPYPQAPSRVLKTLYDAQRQVLYVALAFADPTTNQLLRYSYNGAWGMPVATTVPTLRDVTLSADGSQLLVLTNYTLLTLDAATYTGTALSSVTPGTASGGNLTGFTGALALANDGNILLTTGQVGQDSVSPTFLYTPAPQGFFNLGTDNTLESNDSTGGALATLVASADGSAVVGTESGFNKRVLLYLAANQQMNQIAEQMQPADQPAAVDGAGKRVVYYDSSYIYITDNTSVLYGAEGPSSTGNSGAHVVLINPQGTRTYVITQNGMLWTLDTSTPAPGIAFNQVGQPVSVTVPVVSSTVLRTAVSPDGLTLFVAGDGGVAVIPAPQ